MFDLSVDRQRRRVVVRLSDPFGQDEGYRCATSIQETIARHGWESGGYDLLVDATAFRTQPQTTASAVLEVSRDAPFKARRIACASPSALARLQLRRMMSEREVRFFDTVADAADSLSEHR